MKRLLIAFALASTVAHADERATVERLHSRIAAAKPDDLRAYADPIPGTGVSIEMAPIAAGHGIEAFWMQKFEVTWDQYRLFMSARQAGELDGKDEVLDAVSRPTRPYVEMSFGMGIEGYPAISMTQHAANKFTEWLSARTGHFYRLPTQAEWEYACRAGDADTPMKPLGEYAWYTANSNAKYQKVGLKKPNPWGLYDMLGNVMEWTLDAQAARGGSWNDDAAQVGCAARVAYDPSWQQQDPQLPKSVWYLTDAQWLGFRVVRPIEIPAAAAMYAYWN